jgi:hypothetical protein
MCVALTTHSGHKSRTRWVAPLVTHDFSYTSDEEILVNSRASFISTLLPRLDQVRSWFKGTKAATEPNMST